MTNLDQARLAEGLEKDLIDLTGVIAEPIDPLAFPSGPDFGPVADYPSLMTIHPLFTAFSGETLFINRPIASHC